MLLKGKRYVHQRNHQLQNKYSHPEREGVVLAANSVNSVKRPFLKANKSLLPGPLSAQLLQHGF